MAAEEGEILPQQRDQALVLWQQAVERANAFLQSEARQTLPPSNLVLQAEGMEFRSQAGSWPLQVRSTWWGDLTVDFGFEAQERSDGFVVGSRGEGPEILANSFFREPSGHWRDPDSMAELILHEITHVVYKKGTVGFFPGVAYYLEVIFTFSTVDHSAEELPYATSREFWRFAGKTPLQVDSGPARVHDSNEVDGSILPIRIGGNIRKTAND